MKTGWIVTKDYVDNFDGSGEFDPKKQLKEVTVIGPRKCELTKEELLQGHPFKMYDDDDNLYYEGFYVGDKTSEGAFDPLDHYGTPNAGCTKIFYKKGNKWDQL